MRSTFNQLLPNSSNIMVKNYSGVREQVDSINKAISIFILQVQTWIKIKEMKEIRKTELEPETQEKRGNYLKEKHEKTL